MVDANGKPYSSESRANPIREEDYEEDDESSISALSYYGFISDNLVWRRITRGNDIPRVVLFTPAEMTTEIVEQAHGQLMTGHDGVFKTKERILESYYWPGMDKQILETIKNCHKCQTTKKYHPLSKQPIQPLPQCSQPNQRIHADLFGPLKTSEKRKEIHPMYHRCLHKICGTNSHIRQRSFHYSHGYFSQMDLQIWVSLTNHHR